MSILISLNRIIMMTIFYRAEAECGQPRAEQSTVSPVVVLVDLDQAGGERERE